MREHGFEKATAAGRLLFWYDQARRDLPWRAPPGIRPDPYAVWLSEIMLQQTTVKAVVPYYARFLALWPDVATLAAAPRDDILKAWAGLGYYSRARNLHACAQAIVDRNGGRFPKTESELARLPGIGAYTAAAIAAIAFGRRTTPVDGNVERVVARLHAIETPLPKAKPDLRRLARALTPVRRPGDFAQAMMDLGATVCKPRAPACHLCPLTDMCAAHARGIASRLPYRSAKAEKPIRRGTAFVALRVDGALLLRRRADKGLLGGMMEVPSSDWRDGDGPLDDPDRAAPLNAAWRKCAGIVRHTFTHFHLELNVYVAEVPRRADPNGGGDWRWVARRDLDGEALPSLMRKIVAHALAGSPRAAGATAKTATAQWRD